MLNKQNQTHVKTKLENEAFHWKLATNLKEREAAYHSIYNLYLEAGLAKPKEPQLWLTIHDALEETAIILIEKDNTLIGSATLIIDSPLGLPLEVLYKDKTDDIRSSSTKICEIISLGIEKKARHPKLFLQLMHAMCIYLHDFAKCTDALFTVHPRQAALYQSIGCKLIGEERSFSKVNNLPALLFRLEGEKLKHFISESRALAEKNSPFYNSFFTIEEEKDLMELYQRTHRPISEEELHYFFKEKTDLLAQATEEQRRHILKKQRHAA